MFSPCVYMVVAFENHTASHKIPRRKQRSYRSSIRIQPVWCRSRIDKGRHCGCTKIIKSDISMDSIQVTTWKWVEVYSFVTAFCERVPIMMVGEYAYVGGCVAFLRSSFEWLVKTPS